MKTTLLLFVFASFILNSFAQKVKFDKEVATIDGTPFVKWYNEDNLSVSMSALNTTTEEIFAQWMHYKDPNNVSQANPEGRVSWVELHFLTLDIKFETNNTNRKDLVKFLQSNNVYVNGELNEENVRHLAKKYGTKYSDGRPGGNVKVIINK
jgi:hypothetical protein